MNNSASVRAAARTLLICTATVLVAVAFITSASAHDTKSPATAPHNWLPTIDWVAFHWSPVDEVQLAGLLGMSHHEMYLFQADDHKSFDALAVRKGINRRQLREKLFRPWVNKKLKPAQAREIKRRISLVLSQPHLAQHVFWHPFHSPAFQRDADASAREMFGVSLKKYREYRRTGKTQLEIALVGGKTETHLRRMVTSHLRSERQYGIKTLQTPKDQAWRMYRRQQSLVECWMDSPQPHFDPDIPFGGDINSGHGPHNKGTLPGVLTPKNANGCWLPIVPGETAPKARTGAGGSTTPRTAQVSSAPDATRPAQPLFCDL